MYPFGLEVEQAQATQALHLERAWHRTLIAEARRPYYPDAAGSTRIMRIPALHSVCRGVALALRCAGATLVRLAERLDPAHGATFAPSAPLPPLVPGASSRPAWW